MQVQPSSEDAIQQQIKVIMLLKMFLDALTPRVKPWGRDAKFSDFWILWTASLSVTIHWKTVEQYFTVMLSVFQFYPVCNFGKLINCRLGMSGLKGVIQ